MVLIMCLVIEQISSLQYSGDELKDRCQTLYKGSKKFLYVFFFSYPYLLILLLVVYAFA